MGGRKIPVAIDKFKEEPAGAEGEAGESGEAGQDGDGTGAPEEEKKASADDEGANNGEEAKVEEKDEEDELTPAEWDQRIIEAFHRTIYESVILENDEENLPMEPSDF